jgi:hypothetical protein
MHHSLQSLRLHSALLILISFTFLVMYVHFPADTKYCITLEIYQKQPLFPEPEYLISSQYTYIRNDHLPTRNYKKKLIFIRRASSESLFGFYQAQRKPH